jgi:GT2 family glycosyltransferase/glycosyltransferase involved in cell wall biosynthesis
MSTSDSGASKGAGERPGLRSEVATLRAELARRDQELARLERDRAVQLDELARGERTLALRESRLIAERRTRELLDAQHSEDAVRHAHREDQLLTELDVSRLELRRVRESVIWQLFLRARASLFGWLGGEGSPSVRRLQATLRWIGRRAGIGPASQLTDGVEQEGPPWAITFAEAERPAVSIVMPVHARPDLTRFALASILAETPFPEYELIIIDDAADPLTAALLRNVQGAKIVRNPENLGYQRSVTAGVALARGEWVVLCNNDIVVRPGWLDAMLECVESRSDVGVVTPKYLFPDGTIAEAGGILWRDGTAANYLRGTHAGSCHAAYRREVDYGSAAALLVRTELWRTLGGYDERFAPMYYEDVDLCFAARAQGWRVMYEPRAEVIHFEGSTAGTDETSSHKRHQATNRPRFVEKWGKLLEADHQDNDLSRWWAAADLADGPCVLVVDHTVPTWDQDAGSLRMRTILHSLRTLGCRVTLLPDNHAPLQPYTRQLEDVGVEVLYDVDVAATLRERGPELDLVILSRPHPAARWLDAIRASAPRARVLYDTVDLHWLREARGAATAAGHEGAVLSPRARAMSELEHALIRATDGTIVVTQVEGERVREHVPEAAIHVLPIGNRIRTRVPAAAKRKGVVFVGSYNHPPNVDAALLLANEIMPRIWRALPDLTVTLVGANPPVALTALASPRITVRGWVEDITPVLDGARALVAPIRYGAGLKGKITQALAEGLPVVTTPIGAEGIDATDGVEMLIGGDPDELAARTVELMRDDVLWRRLSREGRRLMVRSGSSAVVVNRLEEVLFR